MTLRCWGVCTAALSSIASTGCSTLLLVSTVFRRVGRVLCKFHINPTSSYNTFSDCIRSNGARAGEVIGLFINGFVSERYGYRKTMIGALMSMTAFIFILFFAPNVQTLVIGEVFCGIPWGMFQTLTTQYASEVAPVRLRPILTTFVNM